MTATTRVADVEKDITAKIRAGSSKREWFQSNYGIEVINEPAKASARLTKIGIPAGKEHQDLKPFEPAELATLELALEKMSDDIIKIFKGVALIRQKMYFKWDAQATPPALVEAPDIGGVTRGGTANPTITIFDQGFLNDQYLFLGGRLPGGNANVEIASAMVFTHELGHVVSYFSNVKKDFDKLVADKHIQPITWYARSDPPGELFAESFALYYSDPEWLQQNWPDLFNFFDNLDKHGLPTPPAKGRKP